MLDDPFGDKPQLVGMKQLPAWVVRLAFVLTGILAVGMILIAIKAESAEPTFSATNENGKLTLKTTPCALGPWFKVWRSAHWIYKGKPYEACWRAQPTTDGGHRIVVIDSEGMVTPIDPLVFVPDEPV